VYNDGSCTIFRSFDGPSSGAQAQHSLLELEGVNVRWSCEDGRVRNCEGGENREDKRKLRDLKVYY